MSHDLLAWKQPPGSKVSPAEIYQYVAEDIYPEEPEYLDPPVLERKHRDWFPTGEENEFRVGAASFLTNVDSRILWLSCYGNVEELYPKLLSFSRTHGLTLFDPERVDEKSVQVINARQKAKSIKTAELDRLVEEETLDLQKRAESGDLQAEVEFANRLISGEGIRPDLMRAFQLYKHAAEAGHVNGMFNLASCYQYGDGCKKDIREAIRWYELAANEDETYATFALGEIYLGFESVPRDNEKAELYFQQALANGHPDGKAALQLLNEKDITSEMKKKAWPFWKPR